MKKAEISSKTSINTSEQIYLQLRGMIEGGDLKPGYRLIQRDLAKQFNTSNIPIVEAIRRLEQDGLVISELNRGARVTDWSIDDMKTAIMIRSSLEQISARLCASQATDEQRKRITELDRQYRDYAATNDLESCRKMDIALHTFIAECSGSVLLTRMINNSRVIINTLRRCIWLPGKMVPEGHIAIVDAIVSGNEELAQLKMKEHIDGILHIIYQAEIDRGF